MDHIAITVSGNDKITAVMQKQEAQIKDEVLADVMSVGEAKGYTKEWNINGETVTLGVEKTA